MKGNESSCNRLYATLPSMRFKFKFQFKFENFFNFERKKEMRPRSETNKNIYFVFDLC